MQKIKNANAAKTKVIKSKTTELNLSVIADKVKDIKPAAANEKSSIYTYPENFGPMQINGVQGKSFRSKMRTALNNMANAIQVAASIQTKAKAGADKKEAETKLLSEVAKFEAHYKANYKVNDLSLQSLTQTKTGDKLEHISLMLKIIKAVKK